VSTITSAVFLSYASEDSEAAASIAAALKSAGIEVWLDRSELRGGDAWDRSIREQIRDCAVFMPIISANAHARIEGYFRLEWKLAIDRSHRMAPDQPFLLPVVIDGTRRNDSRIPDRFRELQWTHLPAGETTASFIDRVRALLSPQAPRSSAAFAAVPGLVAHRPQISGRRVPWLVAAAATVALVATAGYVAWTRVHKNNDAGQQGAATPGQSTATAVASIPEKSVAVLPFADLSEKHDQEYFADGVAEELIDRLARATGLKVIARTSSFSFKGRNEDARSIAAQLGVAHLLEGSVRKSETTFRITVQLIHAIDGIMIWSQTYDRSFGDILRVQSEVAAAVAQELNVALGAEGPDGASRGGTANSAAYDAYLRGMQVASLASQSRDENAQQLAAYDRAIELDPNYALAHMARARTLTAIAMFNKTVERDQFRHEALEAAKHAVELAPSLGESHATLAIVYAFGLLDFRSAAPEFDRALSLAPGNARVQRLYAEYSIAIGRFESALTAARRNVELDPQNANAHVTLGRALTVLRRYAEALQEFDAARTLNPTSDFIQGHICGTLVRAGQFEQARALADSKSMSTVNQHFCLVGAYHGLGRQADAERELAALQKEMGDAGAFNYAATYAEWGDREAALRWLKTADRLRSSALQSLRSNQSFDALRLTPEYREIEARLGFPPL